jgi:hypothetical protein
VVQAEVPPITQTSLPDFPPKINVAMHNTIIEYWIQEIELTQFIQKFYGIS